jgi:iron complex outermembrane receptor protein
VHGYASGNRQEGYRAHSEGYRLRAGLNAARPLGPNTRLRLTAAGDVQDTENPSSITLQNFREDPTQAYQEFVDVNAGKESEQGQVGAFVTHDLDPVTLSGSGYYLYRSLENPLNYATITYDRHSGGGRFTLHRTEGRLEGGIGIDSGLQSDDRVEFDSTSAGVILRDTTLLSQQETVLSGAAFGYVRATLTDRLALTGGLRVDRLRFEADDRLTADGDQSGTRLFSSWSPSVGASYDAGPARLYAQYSTAFETPTASELSNRPSGEGGFNQQVEPQRTRGFEIGARGVLPDAQLQYDVALYRLDVDDLISSYEGPTGRDVYANLAANTHDGIEASFTWQATPNLEMAVRYTGTRFVVTEIDTTRSSRDANLIGNRVPGVPSKRLYLHTEIEHNSLWARLSGEGVSSIYTNNANTAEAPRYVLVDLRVGHRGLDVGGAILKPFAAVDNVLNEDYASSVVVNAFGGRYYEPGPERAFSLGLNVAW